MQNGLDISFSNTSQPSENNEEKPTNLLLLFTFSYFIKLKTSKIHQKVIKNYLKTQTINILFT